MRIADAVMAAINGGAVDCWIDELPTYTTQQRAANANFESETADMLRMKLRMQVRHMLPDPCAWFVRPQLPRGFQREEDREDFDCRR